MTNASWVGVDRRYHEGYGDKRIEWLFHHAEIPKHYPLYKRYVAICLTCLSQKKVAHFAGSRPIQIVHPRLGLENCGTLAISGCINQDQSQHQPRRSVATIEEIVVPFGWWFAKPLLKHGPRDPWGPTKKNMFEALGFFFGPVFPKLAKTKSFRKAMENLLELHFRATNKTSKQKKHQNYMVDWYAGLSNHRNNLVFFLGRTGKSVQVDIIKRIYKLIYIHSIM